MPRRDRKIHDAPLEKPPRGAEVLSSKSNILAAWQVGGYITDEDGVKYHFAIHSPTMGWRGYRWDKQYGVPRQVLPASPNIVWIHTKNDHLMRCRIEQDGKASITGQSRCDELFDISENGCLVGTERQTIQYLRFGEDNRRLSRSDVYAGVYPFWAYFLPDGTITAYDFCRLIVLSPEGNEICEERFSHCGYVYHSHPFIMYHDNNYLYYTDDLRKGWSKSDVLRTLRERTRKEDFIHFHLFAVLGDSYYMAFGDSRYSVRLYRFSSKLSDHVAYIWELDENKQKYCLAHHNGLICITSPSHIVGCNAIPIPENDGFLVWDPMHNAFYTDIPHSANIQKISGARIANVSIPHYWDENAQRSYRRRR